MLCVDMQNWYHSNSYQLSLVKFCHSNIHVDDYSMCSQNFSCNFVVAIFKVIWGLIIFIIYGGVLKSTLSLTHRRNWWTCISCMFVFIYLHICMFDSYMFFMYIYLRMYIYPFFFTSVCVCSHLHIFNCMPPALEGLIVVADEGTRS